MQAEVKGYKDENNRLKVEENGHKNQDDLLKEKETLIQQLKEELQEKNASLNIQIQHVIEEREHFQNSHKVLLAIRQK